MFLELQQWLADFGNIFVQRGLGAALVLLTGLILIRLVMKLVCRALAASRLEKAAHTLILSLCRVGLYLLLGLMTASALGIDVTGIVALASVLTLAISLSLQNMLTNVLGGFTLLSTHPFHSGDYVEIAGQSGTVEEINMTYTRLATPDNKVVSIPNSAVVAAQIVNFTASGTRRVDVKIRAAYDTPPEKVMEALIQAGTADKVLLDPAPTATLSAFDDYGGEYTLRMWVKSEDYWDVFHSVNCRVYKIFREQGIAIPCPQVKVSLDKPEPEL